MVSVLIAKELLCAVRKYLIKSLVLCSLQNKVQNGQIEKSEEIQIFHANYTKQKANNTRNDRHLFY